MDFATLTIILLRITAPLIILRSPLWGIAIAGVLDYVDYSIYGHLPIYQPLDKALDLYYLALCLVASTSWANTLLTRVLAGLFLARAIGVFLLIATGTEWVLLLFPNVFEVLFIFALVFKSLTGHTDFLRSSLDRWVVGTALVIPKLTQEYTLHAAGSSQALLPALVEVLNDLPEVIGALLWLLLPATALAYTLTTSGHRPRMQEIDHAAQKLK